MDIDHLLPIMPADFVKYTKAERRLCKECYDAKNTGVHKCSEPPEVTGVELALIIDICRERNILLYFRRSLSFFLSEFRLRENYEMLASVGINVYSEFFHLEDLIDENPKGFAGHRTKRKYFISTVTRCTMLTHFIYLMSLVQIQVLKGKLRGSIVESNMYIDFDITASQAFILGIKLSSIYVNPLESTAQWDHLIACKGVKKISNIFQEAIIEYGK